MPRPTWTLTGPLSAPHGAVLAGTELTLSLVPGVSRDPSGSDLRAGSTVAVVGADGTLTVKGTGDPVMLLASSPDAPVHYRLSCIPRVLPTVTFTAPEGGSLALDDIVPEVPAPIPAVDASTLRAEWQAALAALVLDAGGVTLAQVQSEVSGEAASRSAADAAHVAAADPHPQYATDTALAAEVTARQAADDTLTAAVAARVTSVQAAAAAPVQSVAGKTGAVTLTPADAGAATAAQGAKADTASQPGHGHVIADTTGLQAALDGKQPAGSYAAGVHTHTAAQIADATTAGRALVTAADAAAQRTALGLGSAATTAATDYATAAQGAIAATAALGRYVGVNAQAGTAYTLVLADEGKLVTLTNAAAITVTLPTNAAVAWPIGGRVDVVPLGAGMVTVVGAGGVTVRATPSAVTRATYSAASLVKIAADEWLCVGDLA